jgi:hypothetical protein
LGFTRLLLLDVTGPGGCGPLGLPRLNRRFMKALLGVGGKAADEAVSELKTSGQVRLTTSSHGEVCLALPDSNRPQANGKISVEVDGVGVPVQVGLSLALAGSKELP